jgi:hypothetical protein
VSEAGKPKTLIACDGCGVMQRLRDMVDMDCLFYGNDPVMYCQICRDKYEFAFWKKDGKP